MGFAIVLVVVLVIVGLFLVAKTGSSGSRRMMMPPRPTGGSMGRLNQPMPSKDAASAIYTNLKARGGLQPGRVYSQSYLQSMVPMPLYGYANDWVWWQMVFADLGAMMSADGYYYPVSPYMYGGVPGLFFGNPYDQAITPMYFDDPASMGMPMDMNQGQFIPPDAIDSAGWASNDMGSDYSPLDQGFVDSQADFSSNDPIGSLGADLGLGNDSGFDSSAFDSGSSDGGFDGGAFDGSSFDGGWSSDF